MVELRTCLRAGHEVSLAHDNRDGVLLHGCWSRVARHLYVVVDDLTEINVGKLENTKTRFS